MSKVYLLGIGGSAMGALACALSDAGHDVSGSDSGVYSPMKEFLGEKDIAYHDSYDAENVSNFRPDYVVVGNAISRGNVELERALNERFVIRSMTEVLRDEFIARRTSVVVSGTHGKTTTSSLVAWILHHGGVPTGFFIGAVTGNFGSGSRCVPDSPSDGFFVSEGDEYDTAYFDKRSKFLSYRPDIAVINNIEFDHADIFRSLDEIIASFRLFARLVPMNGVVIANGDDANVRTACSDTPAPVETFGFGSGNTWRAVDIDYRQDATHFTVLRNGIIVARFSLGLLGEHNVRNALAVIAVAIRAGLSPATIQSGFDTFTAPKRRLEEIASFRGNVVVDDFGHHPTAIRLTIGAVRQKYPGRRIVACFEPRSNTTTRRIFQEELVSAFDDADDVVIGRLNRPERYAVDDRLDRGALAEAIRVRAKNVYVVPQEGSSAWGEDVRDHFIETGLTDAVILLLSNGDLGGLRALLMNDQS
jgi:UDP-N-acetylmuramate: L-alanyl-gamma-D-glutamyl-meso-diaminopimelate ligase